MAVKKTYRHKGGLKPGTYFLIGQHNVAKNGNLMFEGIIGDFLISKGLATTEDNCSFIGVGNGASTVSIEINGTTYPPGTSITDIINALINYLNIINLDGTIDTINGLSGDGSVGNEARLGGSFDRNTTITGSQLYSMLFSELSAFTVTTTGASAKGSLIVSGTQSQASVLKHIKKTDTNVYAQVSVDYNDEFGLQYIDSNGLIGFFIFPDETDVENELAIRTKGVRDGSVDVDCVFTLTDPVTGKGEWKSPSSINLPDYEDDTAAGTGGVAIGELYCVTASNPYGLPDGATKKRRS